MTLDPLIMNDFQNEERARDGRKNDVCDRGRGPAGMILGLLLARAGVEVTVFEKHEDFLRDFRGDTVHPVTMRLLDELGLGPRFAALPRDKIEEGHLRARRPHSHRDRLPPAAPTPPLRCNGPAVGPPRSPREGSTRRIHLHRAHANRSNRLSHHGDTVTGVCYRSPDGTGELEADLTVACDGRTSIVRRDAALSAHYYPVLFDLWWFRLPRQTDARFELVPRIAGGLAMLMIPRDDYFQVGALIPKGSDHEQRARGLDTFRRQLSESGAAVDTLKSWDDVKVLDVKLNRLHRWHRKGLLCIGDAAHAMSPAGGVGINLAVADAVATARLLAEPC
jgi:2-polyprenyl-6-methoxyphenol hydroxylase-like FAD-dependent oxidoreductase